MRGRVGMVVVLGVCNVFCMVHGARWFVGLRVGRRGCGDFWRKSERVMCVVSVTWA